MKKSTDKVVVVGAGPGGCSAAITIKKTLPELEVLLYEQRNETGKRECGEAISHKALLDNKEVLGNLPKGIIVRDVRKIIFKIGDYEKKVSSYGHMIDRPKFNRYLIERAESVGCEVRTGSKVAPIQKTKDGWKINVKDISNETSHKITCDVLVAADGSSSRIAQQSGLVTAKERKMWLRGHVLGYQYKITSPYRDDALKFDFTPKPGPEIAYRYGFYHHDDISNFGFLIKPIHIIDGHYYKTCLEDYLKEIGIEKYTVKEKIGGLIPGGGPIHRVYGNGILVVGDAAGWTNPIFYGGVHPALTSGKIAGEVVAKAYQAKDFSKRILRKYEYECKARPFGKSRILLGGKNVLEKIRTGQPTKPEEDDIYKKALHITKNYGW